MSGVYNVRGVQCQGCTMATALLNSYAIVLIARWLQRLCEPVLKGITIHFAVDGHLLARSRRGMTMRLVDGEFADGAVLFASSRDETKRMLTLYVEVGSSFGLLVNMTKPVFMAVG